MCIFWKKPLHVLKKYGTHRKNTCIFWKQVHILKKMDKCIFLTIHLHAALRIIIPKMSLKKLQGYQIQNPKLFEIRDSWSSSHVFRFMTSEFEFLGIKLVIKTKYLVCNKIFKRDKLRMCVRTCGLIYLLCNI